jgi:hypothetical protein
MLWAEGGENLIFFLFNEKVRFWFFGGGRSGHRVNKFSQHGQVKELV